MGRISFVWYVISAMTRPQSFKTVQYNGEILLLPYSLKRDEEKIIRLLAKVLSYFISNIVCLSVIPLMPIENFLYWLTQNYLVFHV